MAPKAIGSDDKIPCTTPDQLLLELEKLEDALAPEETEDTWGKFEKALLRFAAVTRGGGYRHTDVYLQGVGIKGLGDKIVRCMLSDRGKLSGVATDFLTSMAPRLASSFIPLISLYVPPLIKLLARPNKVYLRRAEKSLLTIAQYCPHPSFILIVKSGVDDKSDTCRRACGTVLSYVLQEWGMATLGNKGLGEVEDAMKRMATERDAEVRKIAKGMWEVYNERFADRVVGFTTPLTPTTRRYLNIKASAGGSSNPPPKMHPLSTSTTAPMSRHPSTLGSSTSMMMGNNNNTNARSVSASSTSAQIGQGSGSGSGQRAVSSSAATAARPAMGSSSNAQTGGFPFPSLGSSSSALDHSNNGRTGLSRSTSAAVITNQHQQYQYQTSSQHQQLAHSRAASSADVRPGLRQLKLSASSTQSSSLQSMIEPVAHSRQPQSQGQGQGQASAGPSRPRVISNVSSTDTALTNTTSASTATAATTTTAAQARRANLAAIGQGPMRPVRTYTALGNVTEGRETSSGSTTPRGNLFGAPVRPNLQARVTSAGFQHPGGASLGAAAGKRVVSAGVGMRKPILPAGVQARVDAKQAASATEGKREEEERDVFTAAPATSAKKETETGQGQEKRPASTARQTFRPTSSTSREGGGGEVKKVERSAPETRDAVREGQGRPVARAPVSSQAAMAMRAAKQSPQAKLVVSPRQPRIKTKPPIPSATVAKKKPLTTKAGAGEAFMPGNVKGRATGHVEGKERTPFRPVSKGMVRSTSKIKISIPEVGSSAVSSPTPKARIIVSAAEVQQVAVRVPLPPSPTSDSIHEKQQSGPPDTFMLQAISRPLPDSPAMAIPATSQNPALLAEEIPLPDSDDEGLSQPTSPTMTPKKLGQIESLRLADLLSSKDVSTERSADAVLLVDEACPVAASSPAPSSSAETIPMEWESDVHTEDEGAEGDIETEAETSIASVTFKKPEDRNPAQKNSLARAVARRLVAQKAEMEKDIDLLRFSSESEPEKEIDLLEFSEASGAEDEVVGKEGKAVASRILADKGNLLGKPVALPATPDKSSPSQKRPRVKQLQEFFENLSPPEQNEGQSPGRSSPLGHTSGRAKVRMLGHNSATPGNSPPPRMTA